MFEYAIGVRFPRVTYMCPKLCLLIGWSRRFAGTTGISLMRELVFVGMTVVWILRR